MDKNKLEKMLRKLRLNIVSIDENSDEYLYISGMIESIKELLGYNTCYNNTCKEKWSNIMYM